MVTHDPVAASYADRVLFSLTVGWSANCTSHADEVAAG